MTLGRKLQTCFPYSMHAPRTHTFDNTHLFTVSFVFFLFFSFLFVICTYEGFFSSPLLSGSTEVRIFKTRDEVFPRRANGYNPRICFLPLIILRIAAFGFSPLSLEKRAMVLGWVWLHGWTRGWKILARVHRSSSKQWRW
jgi:hypothetical protein